MKHLFWLLLVMSFGGTLNANYFPKSCVLSHFNALEISPRELRMKKLVSIQRKMRASYLKQIEKAFLIQRSPFLNLPDGISGKFKEALIIVKKMSHDPLLYFDLAQGFEREVVKYSIDHDLNLKDSFSQLLLEQEAYYGFSTLVRVSKFMDDEKFLSLIHQGHPVMDDFYLGLPHSRQGHRVQSILQARYFAKIFLDPSLYIGIYKYTGNLSAAREFDWAPSGVLTLVDPKKSDMSKLNLFWFLYDIKFGSEISSFEITDFSNPEFFSELRKFLPGLLGWD